MPNLLDVEKYKLKHGVSQSVAYETIVKQEKIRIERSAAKKRNKLIRDLKYQTNQATDLQDVKIILNSLLELI